MTEKNSNIEFSLTWVALKLLGKDLYSHPWSAISELVANGIDARATEVYVHIDISQGKENARLEIYDNGAGMDENGINTYTRIGYDKRKDGYGNSIAQPMGRKGIGKLAALYLSRNYNLLTKTNERNQYILSLNVSNDEKDDSTPALKPISFKETIESNLRSKWKDSEHGTLLQIININLKSFGKEAFKGLRERIADQFLTYNLPNNAKIYFELTERKSCAIEFLEIQKKIASNNFLLFSQYPAGKFNKFKPDIDSKISLEVSGKKIEESPECFVMSSAREGSQEIRLSGDLKEVYPEAYSDKTDVDLHYNLSGWIGMHASIKNEIARENDENFQKNKYHNPAQIRLYVRKKLATNNILPLIGSTQTYANYIEGEISFDILDHDDLPDIATTSREGFDLSDPRVDLLRNLLNKQVRDLINARGKIIKSTKEKDDKRANNANLQLVDNVKDDISDLGIKPSDIEEITSSIRRNVQQLPVEAKQKYRIFLSHASADKPLSDLVWELLKERGARIEEVFYTSRDYEKAPENGDLADLERQMRDNISSLNTRILYITSEKFRDSEYCLFEAGAGWITRSAKEYDILTTSYNEIPQFLKKEKITENFVDTCTKELVLNRNTYQYLIRLVNRAINHLNKGRAIMEDTLIPSIEEKDLPTGHYIASEDLDINDLYDQDIKNHFEAAAKEWRDSRLQ